MFCSDLLHTPVPPVVRVHHTEPADYGVRTILHCSVLGFYPQKVQVSWLRDGVEVSSDVSSTDVLANEDWSFQVHSYLELTPRRGERMSCRVEHSSLPQSLEVDWDTLALDLKCVKVTVGILFFLVGLCAAAGGAVYFWWRRRFDFSPVDRQGQTSSCLSEF
ncbi:beta-2-microglobulin-like [Platichthys flesus]|uniref:beta-2-microglobulin-like n=1 Tax=Platichthys flesus TaxID=8260 RepID=UPI002DBD30DF|nr:beta-2-microglobulin-like [Platichthys flesus]